MPKKQQKPKIQQPKGQPDKIASIKMDNTVKKEQNKQTKDGKLKKNESIEKKDGKEVKQIKSPQKDDKNDGKNSKRDGKQSARELNKKQVEKEIVLDKKDQSKINKKQIQNNQSKDKIKDKKQLDKSKQKVTNKNEQQKDKLQAAEKNPQEAAKDKKGKKNEKQQKQQKQQKQKQQKQQSKTKNPKKLDKSPTNKNASNPLKLPQIQPQQKPKSEEDTIKDSGLLEAYQLFLRAICKHGLPTGDVYEFAAQQIQKYEKRKKAKELKLKAEMDLRLLAKKKQEHRIKAIRDKSEDRKTIDFSI